jgi:DNA-3-methyladenine glycosylase
MTPSAAPSPKARRSRLGAPLPASFYDRATERVARDLLGAMLVCRTPDGVAAGRIVETEAYVGEHDLACHAAAGLTERTAPLYDRPGIAYVYFIYGMHWCFNAVTRAKGEPSAVLVRAIEPLIGIDLMRARRHVRRDVDLTNGPAKLCEALGIDRRFNRASLQRGALTIRDGPRVSDSQVAITRRIGIRHCADWPLRWIVRDNPFISGNPRQNEPVASAHSIGE